MDNELMGGGAWYKNKKILAIVALVVIVLGAMLFRGGGDGGTGGDDRREPMAGEIEVTGKLGCTPLRSGAAPSASECVLGLQGEDGKFYALDNSRIEIADEDLEPDSDIRIVGTYAPANDAGGEASIFRYDGVMSVRVLSVE